MDQEPLEVTGPLGAGRTIASGPPAVRGRIPPPRPRRAWTGTARRVRLAASAASVLLAVACVGPLRARRPASAPTPPPAGYVAAPPQLQPEEVRSHDGMVVCGSPEAAKAGAAVLAAGGNAVDAAVVTALALGSAEPVTSGIGGQAFILIYFKDGRSVAIDGSCVVPTLANPAELQAIRNVGTCAATSRSRSRERWRRWRTRSNATAR